MKSIVFTSAGTRQWLKLAAQVHHRIDNRLMEFARTGMGDVKRLKGRQGSRLRVGDWRVISMRRATRLLSSQSATGAKYMTEGLS
jgi:mRNA interferase RelE/StbE